MGHVDNEVSADLISDLAHTGVVNQTAVSRSTRNKTLGAVELSVVLKHVVVNNSSLEVDTVGEGLEVGGDSGNPTETKKSATRYRIFGQDWNSTYFLVGIWYP